MHKLEVKYFHDFNESGIILTSLSSITIRVKPKEIEFSTLLQDAYITVQELCRLIQVHVHWREVQLSPTYVTLCIKYTLLLEPEWSMNVS